MDDNVFCLYSSIATASSQFGVHSAQHAIDGVTTSETCYWSEPSVSSWWELDLGADIAVNKIRITNTVSVLGVLACTHVYTVFCVHIYNCTVDIYVVL